MSHSHQFGRQQLIEQLCRAGSLEQHRPVVRIRERHVPLVQAVPGLKRFTISLPHADGAPYLVAELWFADGDALSTARTSAAMAAVRADSATYDVARRVIFAGSVEDV